MDGGEEEDLEERTKDSLGTDKQEGLAEASQEQKPALQSSLPRADVSGKLSDYLHGNTRNNAYTCL